MQKLVTCRYYKCGISIDGESHYLLYCSQLLLTTKIHLAFLYQKKPLQFRHYLKLQELQSQLFAEVKVNKQIVCDFLKKKTVVKILLIDTFLIFGTACLKLNLYKLSCRSGAAASGLLVIWLVHGLLTK